jgi:DNA-binding MarR family transcriptional regulator
MDHDLNVIGALAVVLGDRLRDATEEACGMRGALPAALSALHEWAGGRPIETLAGGLRLSHSRTVRVVDRLEQKGLARRAPDPADGRGVLVHLTPAGRRLGRRVLDARAAALARAVGEPERRELAPIAERLLGHATTGRRAARANCRLCDAHACGHHDGRCPVTRAADAAESAQSGGGSGRSPSSSQTSDSMS